MKAVQYLYSIPEEIANLLANPDNIGVVYTNSKQDYISIGFTLNRELYRNCDWDKIAAMEEKFDCSFACDRVWLFRNPLSVRYIDSITDSDY